MWATYAFVLRYLETQRTMIHGPKLALLLLCVGDIPAQRYKTEPNKVLMSRTVNCEVPHRNRSTDRCRSARSVNDESRNRIEESLF